MPAGIADDDRAQLLSITLTKEVRIEGNRLRQLSDVSAIDRAVADLLIHAA